MARIKINKNISWKLRASSLVEVITSMVIISMVFGFAITIYLSVLQSGVSMQKILSRIILHEEYSRLLNKKDFTNFETQYGQMVIIRNVEKKDAHLIMVSIEVITPDRKVLAEGKYLIYD